MTKDSFGVDQGVPVDNLLEDLVRIMTKELGRIPTDDEVMELLYPNGAVYDDH